MIHLTEYDIMEIYDRTAVLSPLITCMTNEVAMNWTANVLTSLGISPVMVVSQEEAADFADLSKSLLVNTGMLTPALLTAMNTAIQVMRMHKKPWVLDPVAAHPQLSWRFEQLKLLVHQQPTVIRGNAGEIMALAGFRPSFSGVDSTVNSDEAQEYAQHLAAQTGAIIVMTGAIDYIVHHDHCFCIPVNIPQLTQISATGCALSAMVAGYLAVVPEEMYFKAAITACMVMKVAGYSALKKSQGPGTMAIHLLDEFANLSLTTIRNFNNEKYS